MAAAISALLASIAVLSVSQAWVLGRAAPRQAHYVIAWIVSSLVLACGFGGWYSLGSLLEMPVDMVFAIVVVTLAIVAAALWSGARRGARLPQGEPFLGRILAVVPVHIAVVLVGHVAAFFVLGFILLGHIH